MLIFQLIFEDKGRISSHGEFMWNLPRGPLSGSGRPWERPPVDRSQHNAPCPIWPINYLNTSHMSRTRYEQIFITITLLWVLNNFLPTSLNYGWQIGKWFATDAGNCGSSPCADSLKKIHNSPWQSKPQNFNKLNKELIISFSFVPEHQFLNYKCLLNSFKLPW